MSLRQRIHDRAHHRGLHGKQHINKQRRRALLLVGTGLARAVAWLTLGVLYLAGVPFTAGLFKSVAFVALISLYANAATDFGQACASLAELTAGDAHHDIEATRSALAIDTAQLDSDIAKLAALQPGPDAQKLADEIRQRLAS